MIKLAKIDIDAYNRYYEIKAFSIAEITKLTTDQSFVAVDGIFPYSSRFPGFQGDAALTPMQFITLLQGRFEALESEITASLNIDRTGHMRDYFISSYGYSEFYRDDGKEKLQQYSAKTIITINGFTSLIKSADNTYFITMSAGSHSALITQVSPVSVLAFESAASNNISKILANEIINDRAKEIYKTKKDLFEEILGFSGFGSFD